VLLDVPSHLPVTLRIVDERRFQVFVSSTFLDLQDERAAVVSALLQMDAFPAGMELFPAADDDAWTLIQRVIDSSDYYLLVIGGKYGSLDPGTELSYTEMEYDYAVANGKPVMAFLHANPETIAFGKSEKDEAAREKLTAFRKKVESHKHVKYWNGPDDLAGKVALSYANFQKTYPAVGWIRGDAQASSEALSELNELRKQLAETERNLASAHANPPLGSERLSQGDEPADISLHFTAEVQYADDQPWNTTTYRGELDKQVTWDDLFRIVGPDLLDEGREGAMQRRINEWLTETFGNEAADRVRRAVEAKGKEVARMRSVDVDITPNDFGTMIVQFRALGLIAKSTRKRSVRDTATYWTLTPHGDDHLTALRAIVRSAPLEAATDGGRPTEDVHPE
jgi:hypothetical protein